MNWVGGQLERASTVTLAPNSTLIVAGGAETTTWRTRCDEQRHGGVGERDDSRRRGHDDLQLRLWNAQMTRLSTTPLAVYGVAFNNSGIFRKSGGTNTTAMSITFNNQGEAMEVTAAGYRLAATITRRAARV